MCNGSNHIIRARAMAEAGWWPTWTLTEGVGLAQELAKLGYRGMYVDEALAVGEVPLTTASKYTQYTRFNHGYWSTWTGCRGRCVVPSISRLTSHSFLSPQLVGWQQDMDAAPDRIWSASRAALRRVHAGISSRTSRCGSSWRAPAHPSSVATRLCMGGDAPGAAGAVVILFKKIPSPQRCVQPGGVAIPPRGPERAPLPQRGVQLAVQPRRLPPVLERDGGLRVDGAAR